MNLKPHQHLLNRDLKDWIFHLPICVYSDISKSFNEIMLFSWNLSYDLYPLIFSGWETFTKAESDSEKKARESVKNKIKKKLSFTKVAMKFCCFQFFFAQNASVAMGQEIYFCGSFNVEPSVTTVKLRI